MPARYPAIVAYDISDNRRRQQVFRVLKDWRIEGQKSVARATKSSSQSRPTRVLQ